MRQEEVLLSLESDIGRGGGYRKRYTATENNFNFGHRPYDESNACRVAPDMESTDTNTQQRNFVPLEQ